MNKKIFVSLFLGLSLISTAAEAVQLVTNSKGCWARKVTETGMWLYIFIHEGPCIMPSVHERSAPTRFDNCSYGIPPNSYPETLAQYETLCSQE